MIETIEKTFRDCFVSGWTCTKYWNFLFGNLPIVWKAMQFDQHYSIMRKHQMWLESLVYCIVVDLCVGTYFPAFRLWFCSGFLSKVKLHADFTVISLNVPKLLWEEGYFNGNVK